jgi:excisionase family DNA binding protein
MAILACGDDAQKSSTPSNSTLSDNRFAFSVAEAAAAMKIGRAWLYQLLASGRIPARKLGRRTIILRADIESFLASLPSYGGKV